MQTIKKTYFTIGPSQLYPGLAKMMNEALKNNVASISHRSDDFRKIYRQTKQALINLLNIPVVYHIFFLGSSIEIMEKIITSCVKQNCVHLVNGAFGEKFYETARIFNKKARKINYGDDGFKAEELRFPKETEMICLTQNETSTGMAIPVAAINKLRQLNPRPLLAVDIVSSAPDVNLNWKLVDLGFFSVQKGFALPAGMAVLIASQKAIRRAEKLVKSGQTAPGFHNLLTLAEKETDYQTPETPNVLAIFLLGQVANKMLANGIKKIRQDTNIKDNLIYKTLRRCHDCRPAIRTNRWRSKTTIVIDIDFPSKKLLDKLNDAGLAVSDGYGENKGKQIRIANFPAHSLAMIKKLCRNLNI